MQKKCHHLDVTELTCPTQDYALTEDIAGMACGGQILLGPKTFQLYGCFVQTIISYRKYKHKNFYAHVLWAIPLHQDLASS
jgi:hypothetical protein